MKKFLIALAAAVLVFTAGCGGSGGVVNPGAGGNPVKNFWAYDLTSPSSFYQLKAERLASGAYCTVWAEEGSGVTAAVANQVANAYDKDIYPKMKSTFSINFADSSGTYSTMDVADMWGDNDGKLCILFLNIRDGSKADEPYVAGYFLDLNLADNIPSHSVQKYSNECDMIYINVRTVPGSVESNTTIAHETMHLMNAVSQNVIGQNYKTDLSMDLWIDEGLASAAEWVYTGKIDDFNFNWFNGNYVQSEYSEIKSGNNFFVWDNYESNSYAIMDEYATVYLFFQWLRLQSNTAVWKDIILSNEADYRAVVEAAGKNFQSYSNWAALLEDWLLANYSNEASGVKGYKNDSVLKNIKQPFAPGGSTSIPLYPGEGVFSSGSAAPTASGNIKYNTTLSGALLTYNANNNNKAGAETGTITGVSAKVNAAASFKLSVNEKTFTSRNLRIGIQDALSRNGHDGSKFIGYRTGNFRSENRFLINE